MMDSSREREHLLALKVMRLTRPSLHSTIPIATDAKDMCHEQFTKALADDIAGCENLKYLSCGNLLTLPQSFGNIYLGETFSCYVSVRNDSQTTVKNVSVQADLQIGPQKFMLIGHRENSSIIAQLRTNESVDDVIHHEVKEIGTHILACTVSYTTTNDEKLHFRKFFKFQVSKPLDVKTKFCNTEVSEVYMEAQLQNITSSPMCLEKVTLEASANYTARQFNYIADDEWKLVFGSVSCLNPLDSRQYLFRLTPKPEIQKNMRMLNGILAIGKLDIVWRTNMGERGRLQTSQLERTTPTHGEIKLSVEELPSLVYLEKGFSITCRLMSTCDRSMNLSLTLMNNLTNGLMWQGISGHQLQELEPHSSIVLQLDAVPIKTGILIISGIRLTDTFLKRNYDFDELAQVFVCSEAHAA